FTVVSAGQESGKILAEADRLVPISHDDDRSREPLLPVRVVGGLADRIWRVAWESGPVLELNKAEPEVKHLLTADAHFKWLVLPEVLRSILPRILLEELDAEHEPGESSLGRRWLDF